MERLNPILVVGLALTHLLWAASLLLEPAQFTHKITSPILFATIHLATAMLLAARRIILGLMLSSSVLGYYWAFVKPLEPVAEPQSVGILAISVAGLLITSDYTKGLSKLLARAGLAYPFIEWGLDALRNPGHFAYYLSMNQITGPLAGQLPLYSIIFALGVYEIVLGVWVFSGFYQRYSAAAVIATLTLFSIIAEYPLALPQNLALITAAIAIGWKGLSASS